VEEDSKYACSFCGKSPKEVRKILSGPKAQICNECVSLCSDILAEETGKEEERTHRCFSCGQPGALPVVAVWNVACDLPPGRHWHPLCYNHWLAYLIGWRRFHSARSLEIANVWTPSRQAIEEIMSEVRGDTIESPTPALHALFRREPS
jgi:hypothetical protein